MVYDEARPTHVHHALETEWVNLREYDLARPLPSAKLLKRLEPLVPNVVRDFQRTIRRIASKGNVAFFTPDNRYRVE